MLDAFNDALDVLYDELGQAAKFQDYDGQVTDCHVIFSTETEVYGDQDLGSVSALSGAISVRRSDIKLAPRRGDAFFLDGVEYRVDRTVRSDDLEHTVTVS